MCILFLKSARCSLKLRTPLLRFCFATVLFIPMNEYINFRTHLQPMGLRCTIFHGTRMDVDGGGPLSIFDSFEDLFTVWFVKFFNVQGFSRAGYPYFIFSLPVYTPRFDICIWFGCDFKESPCRKEAIYIYIYIYIYVCVYFIFNRSFSFTKQSLYNKDHCSP